MTHPIGDYLICRMCLVEDAEMTCIFDVEEFEQVDGGMCEAIKMCASVQITKGDGLPEQMCSQCVEDLKRAILFKNRCEKSDITLRGLLNSSLISRVKEEPNEEMDLKVDVMDSTVNFGDEYPTESSETSNDATSRVLPEEVLAAAAEATVDLLPCKSAERYSTEYQLFQKWLQEKKIITSMINEDVLMAFFLEKSKNYKPSSLWSKYSMIKKMLLIKENINITSYRKLISFIKNKNIGHETNKSMVLSKEEVVKFITDSPDEIYLMIKVALLFGIYGACRREELSNILIDDIDDRNSMLVITIPKTKTDKKRVFSIVDDDLVSGLQIYRKYISLRPKNLNHRRFFLRYNKNTCTAQPVGKNMFGAFPRTIAKYLQLPNPEKYTGHTFRSTSVTLLADSDITCVKRRGGWKSTFAEGYLEDLIASKQKIPRYILGRGVTNADPCTAVSESQNVPKTIDIRKSSESISVGRITFNNI